jgi:carboxylate-amine ligase
LLEELQGLRNVVVAASDRLNVRVAGGGAHPFQHWSERRIFDKPRFHYLSDMYGYLAKQFTVFGQHIHIGCPSGDDALWLLHEMSRYVPHFIALAAASPHYQGVDTAFDSSRLNTIFAFPLSGRAPFCLRWDDFNTYFDSMRATGVVNDMKDFYWDIRPKPEFGTIEIRVCDTPLTVERAAAIAAYAQVLCRWLLVDRGRRMSEDIYLPYTFNRFQACRFGLDGELVDPLTRRKSGIAEDVLSTLDTLQVHARELDAEAALAEIAACARQGNDAQWLRETFAKSDSLHDLVWQQAERWKMGKA